MPPVRMDCHASPTHGDEALASVVVDRLLGILSLVAMAIVGLLAWTPARGPTGGRRWPSACGRGGLPGRLLGGSRGEARVPAAIGPAGHGLLLEVGAGGQSLSRSRRASSHTSWPGRSLVQLLRISQAYLLGLGLGIAVPFRYYLCFMPIGLLMLLLPISVSGFGLPQGVIVWLLRPLGVPDEQSFALSTLIVLTGLAGNSAGAAALVAAAPGNPVES